MVDIFISIFFSIFLLFIFMFLSILIGGLLIDYETEKEIKKLIGQKILSILKKGN